MRADPAPRTLRPALPHQTRGPQRHPSRPERFGWFGRWSRRSRLTATAVVIVSLALVGALVISSAQAVRAVAGTNDGSRYGRSTPVVVSEPDFTAEPGYLPGHAP
ncbi:hypothetical protein [Kineosporia succinea]|uniref:Membrane-associated PAP2 superfamily phosphatase n=1 Tax=Kineosporia succinea TaxID=84632 RepID=A0ABT9NY90_9ACTN|nr:hypothetical protein [Kineosporia succinea]MDP9825397.1 membrane-associated PAP2 superfamily phosphatase [Kineosporia succinea]